jgi:ribosomal protein S19E (S16A)
MSGVWTDGLQWVVHLLQELKEDGPIDNTVCGKVIVPRGMSFTDNRGDSRVLNSFRS